MIYISTPPEGLKPETAKANIKTITDRLLGIGLLAISPLKFGITETWTEKQKQDYREKVLRERASCIFLQKDWNQSDVAKQEFLSVYKINRTRPASRYIQIYFEDFGGLTEIEADIRNEILIPHIV